MVLVPQIAEQPKWSGCALHLELTSETHDFPYCYNCLPYCYNTQIMCSIHSQAPCQRPMDPIMVIRHRSIYAHTALIGMAGEADAEITTKAIDELQEEVSLPIFLYSSGLLHACERPITHYSIGVRPRLRNMPLGRLCCKRSCLHCTALLEASHMRPPASG